MAEPSTSEAQVGPPEAPPAPSEPEERVAELLQPPPTPPVGPLDLSTIAGQTPRGGQSLLSGGLAAGSVDSSMVAQIAQQEMQQQQAALLQQLQQQPVVIEPPSPLSATLPPPQPPPVTFDQDEAIRRLLGTATVNPALRPQGSPAPPAPSGLSPEERARRAADRLEAETTCFRLAITGEIESAELGPRGRGPLMCVFTVQHGADWTLVSGAPNGITQLAVSSPLVATSLVSALLRGVASREVVWNFPLGFIFKSTSPFGWPRLIVTVYGTDLCNRRVVKGYGSVHMPCQPGRHTRTIRLYCPLSSSPLTRILGALLGNPAQFVDPRLIAGTEGRDVVRVQSGGKVNVIFDIILRDTDLFNYTF